MTDRQIIGEQPCADCGAKVQRRVNKGQCVYYRCDGAADDHQCGAAHTYGKGRSRQLIAAAAKPPAEQVAAKPAAKAAEKPAAKPPVKPPAAKPAAKPDQKPTGKPSSAWGIFD
jgi:hypothetical protein